MYEPMSADRSCQARGVSQTQCFVYTAPTVENQRIRNFCIIAHIDHGKSTLADRFIQRASLVSAREFHDQILDNMEIERERGITIKSQAVAIPYKARDGVEYVLNLVDTQGTWISLTRYPDRSRRAKALCFSSTQARE